jgi:hypothetical protein
MSPPAPPQDVAAVLDARGPVGVVVPDGDLVRTAVQARGAYGISLDRRVARSHAAAVATLVLLAAPTGTRLVPAGFWHAGSRHRMALRRVNALFFSNDHVIDEHLWRVTGALCPQMGLEQEIVSRDDGSTHYLSRKNLSHHERHHGRPE